MAERADIIRMAREAGVNTSMRSIWPPTFKRSISFTPEELERFVELVKADAVAAEREACAKLCDQEVARWRFHAVAPSAAAGCAVLIRARGHHG